MFSWLGLLEASAVGGIGIVLFFLISGLLGERYRASYKKVIWLMIALRLCIPVSLSLFPKLVTVHVPVYMLAERGNVQAPEKVNEEPTDVPQILEEGTADDSVENTGIVTARRQRTSQDIWVMLWSIGCAGVLLYYLLIHCIFYRKMRKKSRRCANGRILSITAKAAEELGLKRIPQVRLTADSRTGPFTVGFLRNIVFLPDTDYPEKDLQYIIRHELVHCAGKDTQMKMLLIIVNAIHWFNPFVWLMRSLADQDMELVCDERVLADTTREERSEYGEVLMSCIGTDKAGSSALSTGYAQGVKFIKKRFRNIFNMQKKSGKAAGSIMLVLLIAISAGVGFETGRTVYARSGIAIDSGIELRTDVTGDGLPDRVVVYDDTQALTTQVALYTADGRETWFSYEEDLWASSYLVCGDLSGNGAADIVLMRGTFGMHLVGCPSVLYVTETSGEFVWQEYPEIFISNPAIVREQPGTFDDIECLGVTVIEKEGRSYLRLVAMDNEYFAESYDDDQVLCIDCFWQGEGWYIEDMQAVSGYYTENKESELLINNAYGSGK